MLDNVRPSEAGTLIAKGVMELIKYIDRIIEVGATVLGYNCNERCRIAIRDNEYRCRRLNSLKITTDNTKHIFKLLPNDYSIECLDQLIKIGLVEPQSISDEGYVNPFKSCDPFFHPKRHPPLRI